MNKHIIATKRSGDTHQSISDYEFRDDMTGETEWKTKTRGVLYVMAHPGWTSVWDGQMESKVEARHNPDGSDYLQTRDNGFWTDTLLDLPQR